MRAKPITLEVPTIGTVQIRVFHACPSFHTGRAISPSVLGQWWAERGLDGWVYLWDLDNIRARFALEAAIEAVLPLSPSDLARSAQDTRGEEPQ
jgi:hypothetical protein